MVNLMVWIDDTVVYRDKKGQNTTLSSMNKLDEIADSKHENGV
jgi:hypothetical protein